MVWINFLFEQETFEIRFLIYKYHHHVLFEKFG